MSLSLRLRAVARQRCPVCFDGRMFVRALRMNAVCPTCGHRFEREPGFFQGAMYISYILAVTLLLVVGWSSYFLLAPRAGIYFAIGTAVGVHLAAVPTVFRYSRVIWAHLMSGTLEATARRAPPGAP